MTVGGSSLPVVLDSSSPLPRSYASLVAAVETHAAIRDDSPHTALKPLALTALSTAEGTVPNGSRRATTRKKAK